MDTGASVKQVTTCRGCRGSDLERVLSLGSTPLANAFLREADLGKPEASFPLELLFCRGCSLVTLGHVVSPEVLFRDYVYVSSTSPVFVAHFEQFAAEMCERFRLPQGSLVLDIGSNDGILLRPYRARGMRVLGIDPAVKIAEQATKSGIDTLPAFFSTAVAEEVVRTRGRASIVTATSVFPHVDDLDDLVGAVRKVLADDGVFLIEAYYLGDLLERNLFDTIYHEHLSYFSVQTIVATLMRLGMDVFDVQRTDTHGGSLRVFSQRQGGRQPRQAGLRRMLEEEKRLRMDSAATFVEFARRIEANKEALRALVFGLKQKGERIAAYGAPAKGNTLLNYFQIGADTLDYVVDDSPWKQGLFTPGTHVRVESAERLRKDPPGYLLILAWNFAEPIMRKCAAYQQGGGRFILPVPEPKIV